MINRLLVCLISLFSMPAIAASGSTNVPTSSWRPPVATSAVLPSSGNFPGDSIITNDNQIIYIWNGSAWVSSGQVIVASNESTGSGAALLGANSPASTLTAPYKWIKMQTSDGSTVYYPVWK